MRRRVRDLLRNAVADDEARDALARGVLKAETETTGFAPFEGMVTRPVPRTRATSPGGTKPRDEKRRERERALRAELAAAEKHLKAAERSLQEAERELAKAEQVVASIRAKLERL